MRKVIYSIGILALAALSFASCQKQPVPENESGKMVTVTFVAEAPATKSAAVEGEGSVTYEWSDDDDSRVKLFKVGDSGLTEVSAQVERVSATELTITATVESGSTVRAIMANSFTNSNNPRLSSAQSPKTDNFDPTADVLVSKDKTINSDLQGAKMLFNRKVVVNKMSLHGLNLGEKIKRIIVTSNNHLTGYYDGESFHGEDKTITLSYSDVPVTESSSLVANKGVFPVYFVAAANDAHTLSIRVETDQNVYEKTLGQAISLKLGQFTRFNVGLPSGTPISDSVDYTLVTSASSLPAVGKVGDIIIVNGTNAMAAQNTNNRAVATVPAAVNSVISLDNSSTAHIFSLSHTEDGFLICDKTDDSGYLYAAGAAATKQNYLRSKADIDAACYWTITYSEGVASIVSVNNDKTPYLQYNNSGLFSCYNEASQQPVSIYLNSSSVIDIPVDNRPVVTLSFNPESPSPIYFGDSFNEPTLTKNPADVPIGYTVTTEPSNIATIDSETGKLTITGVGAITVTASVSDETNYKPASASYSLTVNESISDYSTAGTSNVILTVEGGTSASLAELNGYDALKAGTSSNAGAVKITVPANTTNLHLHAAGWKGETVTLSIAPNSIASPNSISLNSNDGITSNSPFTLSSGSSFTDYYFNIALSGVTSETVLTFTAKNGKRFVIWGVNAVQDNRQDPGMSWSASSATASWNTGNTVSGFTAPTLTVGHASGITYESSNVAVATISNAGAVTVVGPGETTIKAVFAGDATYKDAIASYTLTVTDNREQVAKPTFSPDATNTVAVGTQVTITAADGATIYYTLDNSTPTVDSDTYTAAITLDESKTIKAIAVKDGYKNSAVASASYTVGVVNTSTEANPYSASDADALAGQLSAGGTLANVYVSGIISEITTAFNSQYKNVSFKISADGLSTSTQFLIFRMSANSSDDFKVGDAVELKGTLKNHNGTTPELDAGATLIAQLHAPTISPDGGTFTDSQSVTISADPGASIFFSTDGSTPASAYTAAFNITETTTVRAKATKGILTTGIVEATFTKNSGGGGNTSTTTYTFTSKSWGDSSSSWTSGADGAQLTSGRGVQITAGANGANATTKSSFNGVSRVVVTYSTNASSGAGSVAIKVGSNNARSSNVTKTGGTSDRTLTFDINPSETGAVNITVTCTTNSIYIKSVAITHQ